MKICQALRLNQNSRIAWVGAGGKTTSMFRAARQFGGKILVSATAHLTAEQTTLADRCFVLRSNDDLKDIESNLVDGINLIIGFQVYRNRMQGLTDEQILRLRVLADDHNLPLLIEADGARMRPLKAPASHEPPIPPWVKTVVVVAGLSALGKPLDEETIFRSDMFANLAHLVLGSEIRLDDMCEVLLNQSGGLKNIPVTAEKILLFNQADTAKVYPEDFRPFQDKLLLGYDTVLISSMENIEDEVQYRFENIAGVILAAGKSERFGEPKQLLEWNGKPFIRHIAETAVTSGLKPIIVVLGAVIEPIIDTMQGLPVKIVLNGDWPSGISTSIRSGVRQIENRSRGALFLMSDMPQVSEQLIRQYLEFQAQNDFHILAPRVNGQRTNPALFDVRCFDSLKELKGDIGGRQLFDQYPVNWIDLNDPGMMNDVDTPNDYLLMKKMSADDNKK